jgi:hypothetical protein
MQIKYLVYDATEEKESNLLEKNVERLMDESVKNHIINNYPLDSKHVQLTVSLKSIDFTDSKGKDRIVYFTHVE